MPNNSFGVISVTRISKKDRLKRHRTKPSYGFQKTGPKKDHLPKGFKEHLNVFGSSDSMIFIPKIK